MVRPTFTSSTSRTPARVSVESAVPLSGIARGTSVEGNAPYVDPGAPSRPGTGPDHEPSAADTVTSRSSAVPQAVEGATANRKWSGSVAADAKGGRSGHVAPPSRTVTPG